MDNYMGESRRRQPLSYKAMTGLAVIATWLLSLGVQASEQGPIRYDEPAYNTDGLTPTNIVDDGRFVEIPENKRPDALIILGKLSIVPLSDKQEFDLLGQKIEIDQRLDSIAEAIKKTAENHRKIQNELSSVRIGESEQKRLNRESYSREISQKEDAHAQHILELRGKLRPYLVKVDGHNKPGTLFYGWVENSTLRVVSQVYTKYEEVGPYPVIVYLQNELKTVKSETIRIN